LKTYFPISAVAKQNRIPDHRQ